MNRFTLIIHNKGWTVAKAIAHWDINYSTYNRRCNNPKMFNQLESMCMGLDDTQYLLSNKVNRDRLLASIAQYEGKS